MSAQVDSPVHTLSVLDFELPCESADPCPYESPATWALVGTPACGHRLSMLICDYCRIRFQTWVLEELRSGGVFGCGICGHRIGGEFYDVFRLSPLRGTP